MAKFRHIKNDSPRALAEHFSKEKLGYLISVFEEIGKENPNLKRLCGEFSKASKEALILQN